MRSFGIFSFSKEQHQSKNIFNFFFQLRIQHQIFAECPELTFLQLRFVSSFTCNSWCCLNVQLICEFDETEVTVVSSNSAFTHKVRGIPQFWSMGEQDIHRSKPYYFLQNTLAILNSYIQVLFSFIKVFIHKEVGIMHLFL